MAKSENNKTVKKNIGVKKFHQRFKCSKGINVLLVGIFIFSILFMIMSSYMLEKEDLSTTGDENTQISIIWNVCKDISEIIASAIGINLILSLCLEKSSKNKAFEEFFANEIISSPLFYNSLQKDERENMLHALEENCYGNSVWQKGMHKSINQKLKNSEKCKYIIKESEQIVKCKICDEYIEKKITRMYEIVALFPNVKKLKNFQLLKCTAKSDSNYKHISDLIVKINENVIDEKSIKVDNPYPPENTLDKKSEYNQCQKTYLKKLKFDRQGVCKIYTEYTTRVPCSDLSYVCRLSAPCKHFKFDFEIINNDDYKINTYAFGFVDDGKNSLLNDSRNRISIEFKDWIFPLDGVAVVFQKK